MTTVQTWQSPNLPPLKPFYVAPDLKAFNTLTLPDSDGDPMENARERTQITLNIQSLEAHWADRDDFYIGGSMFVYYNLEQAKTIIAEEDNASSKRTAFRGPDLFVVRGVDGSYHREKWVVWQENDHYPDLIIEYLSPSTRKNDLGAKKILYEKTFATHEYFCFEYMNPKSKTPLLGWRLNKQGHYQPIPLASNGWLWSETLELWLGPWVGKVRQDETTWLRFYKPDKSLVLTRAEFEFKRAEIEGRRAEVEARRAELESKRAEAESKRAIRAETELQQLRAKLAEQGIAL